MSLEKYLNENFPGPFADSFLKELETEKHRHLIKSMEEDLESIEHELLTREKQNGNCL